MIWDEILLCAYEYRNFKNKNKIIHQTICLRSFEPISFVIYLKI